MIYFDLKQKKPFKTNMNLLCLPKARLANIITTRCPFYTPFRPSKSGIFCVEMAIKIKCNEC